MSQISVAIVLAIGYLAQVACAGEGSRAQRRLDMSDIITMEAASEPAMRPDGGEVAFVVSTADTTLNQFVGDIWSVGIEWLPQGHRPAGLAYGAPMDAEPPRLQWTRSPEIEADLTWSPTGKGLAFRSRLNRGQSVRGDRIDSTLSARSQVWVQLRPEKQARRLTASSEDVDSFHWLGDGSGIVFKARQERPRAARRGFDGRVAGVDSRPWEFWYQPVDGSAAMLVLTADSGVGGWDVTTDGKRIVYASNGGDPHDEESPTDLWLFDRRDSSSTRLTRRWGPDTEPTISPDNRWIAWKADQDTSITFSQEELWVMEIDRRDGGRCLTGELDQAISRPVWAGVPGVVTVESAGGGGNSVEWLDVESGQTLATKWRKYIERLMMSQSHDLRFYEGFISQFTTSSDGAHGVVLREEDSGTQLLKAYPRSGLPPPGEHPWPDEIARFELTSPASNTKLARQHSRAPDGIISESILMMPDTTLYGPGPYPTITQLHGGPYNRNTARPRDNPTALVLASHGYLVYMPNFRGSKGYGNAFGTAARGRDFAEGPYKDVMAGLDSLIAKGLADSTRLGIMGGSYGGYLSMFAISRTDRFKAAVSMYGMSSLITDFGNGRSPSYELEYLGEPYWKGNPLWTELSPAWHVDKIHTPLLLLHGENDPAVGISNSREMWTALTVLKRPVEFITYPREGHGFREPNHRIDACRRTVAWFDRYLK